MHKTGQYKSNPSDKYSGFQADETLAISELADKIPLTWSYSAFVEKDWCSTYMGHTEAHPKRKPNLRRPRVQESKV